MPSTARSARLVTALGALLVAAGCSSTASGTAEPAAAGGGAPAQSPSDAVQWTDNLCGAVIATYDTVSTPPNTNSSDPAAAVAGLTGYLGRASSALQGSVDALGKLGPSPVQGGDAVVTNLTGTLTKIKTSFDTARAQLDGVDPNDPAALAAALAPVRELSSLPRPTNDLAADPELNSAAQQAPNCQKVRTTSGS